MKRFFTITFLLMLLYAPTFGQVALQVDSPSELAGIYNVAVAGFGGSFDFDITSEVVLAVDGTAPASDACEPITNTSEVAGKIAMIDRGACEFGTKVLGAENAGAIAVIVCNNAAAEEERGGLVAMGAGAVGDQATIPSIFITKEDCDIIRVGLTNNLTVTIRSQYDANERLVWGDTEGKFTDGIGNWTTTGVNVATAIWEHDANGSASKGGFAGEGDRISSPSSNDGAMVFNSDFLDNGGDSTATNMGSSPAPHTGELISPMMDLSNISEVALRFNQLYRNRNSMTSVAFSTDGGSTWSDPIRVNEEVGTEEATATRSIQTIYLPGLGGSAMAHVKFIFEGSLYYWIVDDVKIIEAELYSSSLSAFLFPPSNYGTPASMIEGDSMFFSTLVTNNGLRDLTNVKMTGQIIGGESVLYEDSAKLAMIEMGRADTSLFIDGGYEAPALDVGNYIARYSLEQDNGEYNPSDNTVNMPFEITENTFQKDDGILISATRSTANSAYEYGNIYYIPNDGYQLTEATYSIAVNAGTNIAGQNFLIKLYKVTEDDDPTQFTDDDVELVGFSEISTFPDDFANFELYTVPMVDFDLEPGIALEEDTEYILMFSYAGQDEVFTTFTNVPYGNRVTDILRVEGGTGGPWFTGGFSGETTPVVRMHIDQISNTKAPELAEDQFKLFPNPAVDQIHVALDLEGLSSNVVILIRDLDGKTLKQYQYENVLDEQFTIETSKLNGLYIMTVRTDEGVKSKKFNVFKVR